jgi:predicted ATPase/DNA-binding CsgD family transcriptional regulator
VAAAIGWHDSQPRRYRGTTHPCDVPNLTLNPRPYRRGGTAGENVGMNRGGNGLAERLARAGVTEREADVLWAVTERLRNREIAERLHLSVRTVESHVAALLRKLGATDRAGLVEIGVQLRRTASADPALPLPLTRLVGREHETRDIVEVLGSQRLVTLTGPGGVGKTRLALRVATAQADRFADGARLADLAPVGPDLVADTVARALGVVPRPGWSVREVLRDVAGRARCLLLLDNCEHVVAEAAGIVADLLSAAGELRVLATSREPLGVPGEAIHPVPPMPVPPPDASVRADTAQTFDAVRLFVDRAGIASPGFTLTDALAPDVAALCHRLDGLPLAIELAASRVRSFGPAELVQLLGQRFELLSAGARTAPPRHRTLRGAIDWSYALLDSDERSLFDRLGVFPADFDFAAAQALCADGHLGGTAAVTLLPRLVDKSLVSAVGRGTRRYRLLESVRAYAAARLSASGAEPVARHGHAAHYLALAEQAADQLCTAAQRTWLDRMTTELPNLRAASAHSIAAADVEAIWRWIAALHRFCEVTGHRIEAQQWIERALAAGDPPATPAAVAGLAAASTILQPADARAAFDLAQRAAQLAAGLDDVTRGRAARAVGMGAMWIEPESVLPALHEAMDRFGDDDPWEKALTMRGLIQVTPLAEALDWGRSSVALFRRVGDHMAAANTLFLMAQRSIYAGVADDEVHDWLAESRALAEAAGSEEDRTHATVGFGELAWLRGDHSGAAALIEEVLPTLRRLGDQRCTGRSLYLLGQRAVELGDLARAAELLTGSIRAVTLAGQSVVLGNALAALAGVYAATGRPGTAAMLLGTARAAGESATVYLRPLRTEDAGLRRSLVDALGTATFQRHYTDGQSTSPTEALRVATSGYGNTVAAAVPFKSTPDI